MSGLRLTARDIAIDVVAKPKHTSRITPSGSKGHARSASEATILSAATAFYAAGKAIGAHDASDRIVYDTSSGDLYYDADGLGGIAAIKFASLTSHPAVAFSAFLIV